MKQHLSIGFSPCPNDTFIFYAMMHGKVPLDGFSFHQRFEDIETLNQLTVDGRLDIAKVSYHALGFLRDEYCLLPSGGALGRGGQEGRERGARGIDRVLPLEHEEPHRGGLEPVAPHVRGGDHRARAATERTVIDVLDRRGECPQIDRRVRLVEVHPRSIRG